FDAVLHRGPGVGRRPVESRARRGAEEQLDAARAGEVGVEAHAPRRQLGVDHRGVEEALEARARAPLAALVGTGAPAGATGETALVREQALRGALRRRHRRLTVLHLHLVRSLALVVPAPAGAHDAGAVGAPRHVQARARVRLVGEAGVVP